MDLRRTTNMIDEKWSALGFETSIEGNKAVMTASIVHPAYENCVLKMHILMFDNAARHFTVTIGEIPNRYVDRAYASVNTFNLKHPWLRAFIVESGSTAELKLQYTAVGYGSLSEDEVVTSIMVAGDLMFNEETADKMVGILLGEYL